MHGFAYHVPKRKSVAPGVVLAVLGLVGVGLAAIEYPTWDHNRQVLSDYEAVGLATQDMRDTVAFQAVIMFGGFLVGGPMLLIGIVLLASAMSYNSKLDTVALQRAFTPGAPYYNPPSDKPAFCAYCGNQLGGALACRVCGRRVQ